ncbi:hypothetical protein HGA64_03625 [Candidatus Falkowbacteria bacterium]|nr:hypothetical protein [Candidatus Falkowbacteria bacterium]
MAHIPQDVKGLSIVPSLANMLLSQGKVGDAYSWPLDDDLMISVRTDRLSVYNFVLNCTVARKGEVLTGLTHFFSRMLVEPMKIPHHLAISKVSPGMNKIVDLLNIYPDIDPRRTLAIKKCQILPFELIFRKHPGGSIWKEYLKSGMIAGKVFPPGMKKWQRLDEVLFTPSTKGENDVNITPAEFYEQTGDVGVQAETMSRWLFLAFYAFAAARGIVGLDSKFEVGVDSDGVLTLCDEWLTPDTTRLVMSDNLNESVEAGKEPEFADKQLVREFCATVPTPFKGDKGEYLIGFNNLDPTNSEHREFVHCFPIPENITRATSQSFQNVFRIITGLTLDDYQREYLLP